MENMKIHLPLVAIKKHGVPVYTMETILNYRCGTNDAKLRIEFSVTLSNTRARIHAHQRRFGSQVSYTSNKQTHILFNNLNGLLPLVGTG